MSVRSPTRRGAVGLLLVGLGALSAAALRAENRVANPHFHTDVADWDLLLGTQMLWTDLTDEGDCAASGVALVSSEPGDVVHYASLGQCVGLGEEPTVHAAVRYQAYGSFRLYVDFFTATNCAAGGLGYEMTVWPGSPAAWADASLDAARPPSANAAQLRFVATDIAPHGLVVDAAYLGP
jgi:hypothetical protein